MFAEIEVMAPLSPRRWPLHPTPYPFERVDSYIRRLAECYQTSVQTFCRSALGGDIDLDAFVINPDRAVLKRLSAGTGVPLFQLRNMSRSRSERRFAIALRNFCHDYPETVQKWSS
ncbi:TniQ family protein [Neorhizobium sp. JUb45]|uniref:TniQ family protein n=1 Tax=Neorhizobium sp. JUb45 TaxID=2485113 RepID=UPI001043102F|nr:TniQ family protein [Neorhizobium sp. JUb45]